MQKVSKLRLELWSTKAQSEGMTKSYRYSSEKEMDNIWRKWLAFLFISMAVGGWTMPSSCHHWLMVIADLCGNRADKRTVDVLRLSEHVH